MIRGQIGMRLSSLTATVRGSISNSGMWQPRVERSSRAVAGPQKLNLILAAISWAANMQCPGCCWCWCWCCVSPGRWRNLGWLWIFGGTPTLTSSHNLRIATRLLCKYCAKHSLNTEWAVAGAKCVRVSVSGIWISVSRPLLVGVWWPGQCSNMQL